MGKCKMGYALNEDGTIPQRCHVDWGDDFYPTVCKECPFYNGDEAIKTEVDCEYCKPPFKHCGKYYISTGYDSDPYLHTIRKEDGFGGAMIKYCPWCGRELDPLY